MRKMQELPGLLEASKTCLGSQTGIMLRKNDAIQAKVFPWIDVQHGTLLRFSLLRMGQIVP